MKPFLGQTDLGTVKEKSSRFGRVYSSKNFNKFRQLCEEYSWNTLRSEPSLECFNHVVKLLFDKSFPLVRLKVKRRKLWITPAIRISSKNLRCLRSLRKFTSNVQLHDYYKRYCKIFRRVVKQAKKLYYEQRLSDSANSAKESWGIINELRGSKCRSGSVIINGDAFYCGIADGLTENLKANIDPLSYLGEPVRKTFAMFHTDVEELLLVFKSIKNKNSTGIDHLSLRVLECLPHVALDALAHVINDSFENGLFPDCLKMSVIIPLYKGGDMDDPANFRPKSLLPILSKVIEKLVKSRVMSFLCSNGSLSASQYAFQESNSTNDAMFDLFEYLHTSLNNGDVASTVFCDFAKAFDCVNHRILLDKLLHYGFRGISYKWFVSYLVGRKQLVRTATSESRVLTNHHGVPQGSVLGPVLFLLYINDLASLNIHGKVTLFADDTAISWSHKKPDVLMDIVAADMKSVKEWCNSNRLSLNLKKTKSLSFKFSHDSVPVADCSLVQVEVVKYLGLSIDRGLKFDEHVLELNGKLARGCFAVRVVARELGVSCARKVYYALVESHLRYGTAYWGSCSKGLFKSVFSMQKRAVRYIFHKGPRESCRPIFQQNGILTLTCLFILETVCTIFKKCKPETSQCRTRSCDTFHLPIPRSSLARNSVIYQGLKIFNHLPMAFRAIKSLKTFRHKVGCFIETKAYYDLDEYLCDIF